MRIKMFFADLLYDLFKSLVELDEEDKFILKELDRISDEMKNEMKK